MPKTIAVSDLPALKGVLIPPMAARALRVTRQRVIQMIEEGKFRTASRIPGTSEVEGRRPRPAAYVIREAEVRKLAVANCPSCRWLAAQGRTQESCEHFEVTVNGEVVLHDIPQVAEGGAEPVEHAVPFVAAEKPSQV